MVSSKGGVGGYTPTFLGWSEILKLFLLIGRINLWPHLLWRMPHNYNIVAVFAARYTTTVVLQHFCSSWLEWCPSKWSRVPNSVPFMEETPDTACGGGGIPAQPIYSPINVVKQATNTVRPNRMGARTRMVICSSSSLLYSVSRQKNTKTVSLLGNDFSFHFIAFVTWEI